ncbi:MAG: hypothetical protein ACKO6Q_04255 [Bacteroidota bacterium]
MRHSIFAISLTILLTACKKDSSKEADVAAQITLSNPTSNTLYLNGSPLQIRGNATDDNVLASVNCTIRNKNTNAVLYSRTLTTGNVGFFDFSQDWTIIGITALTPAQLIVTTTDKVGYTATKQVDFQLID